tara:strand:- start:43 stop:342 length:300 start_codon:yes stop_codon:yes gene_type:complete
MEKSRKMTFLAKSMHVFTYVLVVQKKQKNYKNKLELMLVKINLSMNFIRQKLDSVASREIFGQKPIFFEKSIFFHFRPKIEKNQKKSTFGQKYRETLFS